MKASEMLKYLEESIKKYGDLDIVTPKYETPDSLYPYYDEYEVQNVFGAKEPRVSETTYIKWG